MLLEVSLKLALDCEEFRAACAQTSTLSMVTMCDVIVAVMGARGYVIDEVTEHAEALQKLLWIERHKREKKERRAVSGQLVLVCGDREWTDSRLIKKRLSKFPSNTIIMHGDCRGADKLADEVAQYFGFARVICPANWERFGRAAGPIRNRMMVEKLHPDLVLAFHADLDESRGAKDTVARARKAGIEVEVLPKEVSDE